MEITKDEILKAYAACNNSKKLFTELLNISRYYVGKYEKLYDIKFEWKQLSPYTIEYWTANGCDIDTAKYNIAIRRPYNILYWVTKHGEIDGTKKYYEFITKGTRGISYTFDKKCKNHRCIEYWLYTVGCDYETAKIKLKDTQHTFGLNKCIERYGEKIGIEVFNERQAKWKNSISTMSEDDTVAMNQKKDSASISHFITKYGSNWVGEYISHNFHKNTEFKEILLRTLVYSNIEDVIVNIVSITPKYNILRRLLNNRLIQTIYNFNTVDIDVIYGKMLLNYGVTDYVKHKYGCKIKFNNITYSSYGEFQIAKYLTETNIEFLYNKRYSANTSFRYDFYLTELGIYIEYTGLTGKKNYDYRIDIKRQYCFDNKLQVYFSKDVNDIIQYIQKI